ncbi:hypothetical protein V2W45_1456643 [Cenococcum geophilum]
MDRLAGRVQWLVRSIGATSYPEIPFKANNIARDLAINVELKIFPELGLEPPLLDFTRFVGLAHGLAQTLPYLPKYAPPTRLHRHPPTVSPVASIAAVAPVRPGIVVSLNRINTAPGLTPADLTFAWTRTAGPTVTWPAPAPTPPHPPLRHRPRQLPQASPSLKIPLKANPTLFSTATATIKIDPTIKDVVTIDSFTWTSQQGGTLSVTAHSNVVDGSNKGMSLVLSGNTTLAMSSSGGKWTYQAGGTKKPTGVQAKSDLGGVSAALTMTAARRRRAALAAGL